MASLSASKASPDYKSRGDRDVADAPDWGGALPDGSGWLSSALAILSVLCNASNPNQAALARCVLFSAGVIGGLADAPHRAFRAFVSPFPLTLPLSTFVCASTCAIVRVQLCFLPTTTTMHI